MSDTSLQPAIDSIAADRVSGAHDLARAAIDVLRRARAADEVLESARALCAAQPAMAPIWNAALHALASDASGDRLETFARRLERAPAALARVGSVFLGDEARDDAIRIVTFSASRSVLGVLDALRRLHAVHVATAEGRPALEGRGFAARLAALGVQVSHYTDAGISDALASADAVLLGADAVGPDAFVNKIGSGMLAAAATLRHVPVYVAATGDKLVMPVLWPRLVPRDGPADDVWAAPAPGVVVRNPYFEAVSLEWVTSVVTDRGVLSAEMVAQACDGRQDAEMVGALARLTDQG